MIDLLKVVIIGQLLASGDSTGTGKQGHPWLSANSPFDHFAVGLARVVYESCDGTSSGINDHLVVKAHEIVALIHVSFIRSAVSLSHLVFFVDLLHTPLTLRLSDDLTSIFDDDLMGSERPHCSDTVPTAFGLHDLDAVVISIPFTSSLELCKRAVSAFLCCESTICTVALIRHDAVMTGFSTSILRITIALRRILLIPFPQCGSVTNESVCEKLEDAYRERHELYFSRVSPSRPL